VTARTRVDPGLHAVARVRAVRERDSRLGLQRAAADEQRAATEVQRLHDALAGLDGRADGDAGRFVAARAVYLGLCEALSSARRDERAAHLLTVDAAAHWRSDHARLGAVEGLLERRAEARAVEARRTEDRELDDVAGRLWLRQTPAAPAAAAAPAAGGAGR
jgi:flagellar biosynthesis chaperone FliJ